MVIQRRLTVGLDREILTPEFYKKCVDHIELQCAPFLLDLETADHTLFAVPIAPFNGLMSYGLRLDEPEESEMPPDMLSWTWWEYFEAKGYLPENFVKLIMENFYFDFENQDWMNEEEKESEKDRIARAQNLLRTPANEDFLWNEYKVWGSPEARAYHYLNDLEIEVESELCEKVGRLTFIDSPSLGYYEYSVQAQDALSLSLLQARLLELGQKTRIEVICEQ